jgi:hypothetical protein
MSLAIAAFFCSGFWFTSVFDELPERVRIAARVLLAYCAGYMAVVSAGVVLAILEWDPSAVYPVSPVLGAVCAALMGAHGVRRIRSRKALTRVRPIGDGAYRDPAGVPESPEPSRAAVLPPVVSRAVLRYSMGLLFLGTSGAIALIELPLDGASSPALCEYYPRVCSSRSIARAIAYSRDPWTPEKIPDASCRPEDVLRCGRSDPGAYEASRILEARGTKAALPIAEVLGELQDGQFASDCHVSPYCKERVKSLMDLLEERQDPAVAKALRRWFDDESAPLDLRIEAAMQLARLGQMDVLPELAAFLCDYHGADPRSEQLLAEHLRPDTVSNLEPVLSKPGVDLCVLRTSVRALLSVDSPSAFAAIERLGRSGDSDRTAHMYSELHLHWRRASLGTVGLLTRLATDGPEPERACQTLELVQEERLRRLSRGYCKEKPGTPEWRAKVRELGAAR